MRRMISFLLLAATAAGPLAAQGWPQGQRPDGADRGGGDRPDDRRGTDARPDDRRPDDRRFAGQADNRRDRGYDARYDDRRNDPRDDRGRDRDGRDDGRGRPGYAGGPGYGGPRGPDRGLGFNDGRNGGWNDGWRNDRRYDWQGYRSTNRALYRAPRYYGPRGYDYSRWSRGYRVQPYFYGRNYWISDPYRYRLPPAYGNYRWVRYYDDVALVDVTNGLIEDVIYSFFYR